MKQLFFAGCALLLISVSSTGAASAQDPLGRCCYSIDDYTIGCAMLTETECRALGPSIWDEELNCTDDPCPLSCCSRSGDADNSGSINVLDITFIINYLYKNGPDLWCLADADINCDCRVNILDVTCLIFVLYHHGFCHPCTCEQWEENCANVLKEVRPY